MYNTVQNKTTLPKHLHTSPTALYLLGLFNFTFDIPILCSLTYALAMCLVIVCTLYISTYHNSHALVHISTCTCTFQHAHVHSYWLTCVPKHSRPCCMYWQCTIPRSSTQWASLVILINLFSVCTQFHIPYHSP